MRVESIAKKFPLLRARSVSCTVVKTSLIHCASDTSLFKAREDYCNSKQDLPITGVNPFRQVEEMAAKPVERRARSRNFDFYA
jgi:hypothetical protein